MTKPGPNQPSLIIQDHYGNEQIAPDTYTEPPAPAVPAPKSQPQSQSFEEDQEWAIDRLVDQGFTPAMAAGRLGVAKQVEEPKSQPRPNRRPKNSGRRGGKGIDPDYNAAPWNLR